VFDADGDGVCDADDVCEGHDDNANIDGDVYPDGCDDFINCSNSENGDGVQVDPWDCAGVCGGDLVNDDCGSCGGAENFVDSGGDPCEVGSSSDCTLSSGACDCGGNVWDCAGECGGFAFEDCDGECNGDAELDLCGICNGEDTEMCVDTGDDIFENCPMDCEAGCELVIELNGTAASADEDFDCVWSVGSMSRDEEAFPYELTLNEGVHTFTLTCMNSEGFSQSDDVTITIYDDAELNIYPTFSLADLVSVTANHTGDPDSDYGDIIVSATDVSDDDAFDGDGGLSYEWSQVSGTLIDGGAVILEETLDLDASPGDYGWDLTISDCYGDAGAQSTLITVEDALNDAPEASSTASADGVQDSDISGGVAIFTPVHDGDSDADDVVVTISSESSDGDGDAITAHSWSSDDVELSYRDN
jgi:hypothetical protein